MNDYVWQVTVTDRVLFFDKVDKPSDWNEKTIKQPYGELNGTYLGYKQYDSNHWYLRRDKKMPENSGMSWTEWRTRQPKDYSNNYPYETGYSWEPSSYYKYDDKLYCIGAHFH